MLGAAFFFLDFVLLGLVFRVFFCGWKTPMDPFFIYLPGPDDWFPPTVLG